MATTILTTCTSSIEANLIKGMLENNGIRCFLTNENFSNLMPHYAGIMGSAIQVIIDESDLDIAKQLILPQETATPIVCPNCQSSNTRFGLGPNKTGKVFTVILSLLFWIPFGNIRNNYYCKDCKTEFKLI